jgi:asparagine synthase (glutamine-hydrolysing)
MMSSFCAISAAGGSDFDIGPGMAAKLLASRPDCASHLLQTQKAEIAVAAIRPDDRAAGSALLDNGLLIVCSARIDRREQLAAALGEFAPQTISPSPAEWIAAAWRRWGSDCPQHLYGDYAFFVRDSVAGKNFCARDHAGTRPLFYTRNAKRFVCASDITTLLNLPDISLELDESFIAGTQLEASFQPHAHSFYRDIERLPAGHCLLLDDCGFKIWQWWQPGKVPVRSEISDDEAITETHMLLTQAISDRVIGAKRLGFHISGGLDSSLVASMAVSAARQHGVHAEYGYCWQQLQGVDPKEPEARWITNMGEYLGLKLRAPPLLADDVVQLLARDWTRHPDAKHMLHENAVQQVAAADGVTRILSGWGGDEGISFSGRGHKAHLLATGRWLALWREANQKTVAGGLRVFYEAARLLFWSLQPEPSVAARIRQGKTLLDPKFALRAKPYKRPRIREIGVRNLQLSLLQHGAISSRVEDWAISGAEYGIEYAYPLLDRALLEFVLTLPPRMFMRGGEKRWLMREVLRGHVPELIRTNKSKVETVRVDQMEAVLVDAYRTIGGMLAERPVPPERAKYLDMAKLQQRLEKVDHTGSARDRPLRLAIQLLDLT